MTTQPRSAAQRETSARADATMRRAGHRIRLLRLDQNISQTTLAIEAGTYTSTICRIELGTRGDTGGKILIRVAAALGVRPGVLFDDEHDRDFALLAETVPGRRQRNPLPPTTRSKP